MSETGTMMYIELDELTVRIAEACMNSARPPGLSAQEVMKRIQALSPEGLQGFKLAALVAATYIAECCNAVRPGSVEVKGVVANPGGFTN